LEKSFASFFFNRERKSFLRFHWNGVTILAIPENPLLFYVTHFQVLAGSSVSRMRSMGCVACMGEMRNTYRFLVSKHEGRDTRITPVKHILFILVVKFT